MKILVIDDEEPMVAFLTDVLEDMGITPLVAMSCSSGLEILRSFDGTIDAVLVDWRTPGMTGIEFAKAVRADPKFANTVLIMTTGLNDMENVVEALEAGMNEYLMKPFTPDMIVDKLRICGIEIAQNLQSADS